jgi:hypothetical protein
MSNNTDKSDQKHVLGMPYDFRKPTVARVESRYWNSQDSRLFTPKVYGVGWTINVYWLRHPLKYFRQKPITK